jgi:hypothetical protein
MTLIIEPVRTRKALGEFIRLPRHIYQEMPGYVAPLDIERRELIDPKKSPFFTHGQAAFWIARRGGRAVGRISAQVDSLGEEGIGLFGCFDAIDDADVVARLLATAEGWLRARGRRVARGPVTLSINGEPGLQLDGQTEPPVTLFAWHPPYLEARLRAAGYSLAQRLLTFMLDYRTYDHERLGKAAAPRPRADITIRDMRLDHLDEDAEIGRRIFNDGWKGNWGFTPASEADIRALLHKFRPFLFNDSGFFVNVRGKPAAFILTIPNVFDISADLGANPSPIGWLKFGWRLWRQRYRGYRLALIGVDSKLRDTLLGARATTAALAELRRRMSARGAESIIAGWIVESNRATIRLVETFGFQPSRTYGVYERNLIG